MLLFARDAVRAALVLAVAAVALVVVRFLVIGRSCDWGCDWEDWGGGAVFSLSSVSKLAGISLAIALV